MFRLQTRDHLLLKNTSTVQTVKYCTGNNASTWNKINKLYCNYFHDMVLQSHGGKMPHHDVQLQSITAGAESYQSLLVVCRQLK